MATKTFAEYVKGKSFDEILHEGRRESANREGLPPLEGGLSAMDNRTGSELCAFAEDHVWVSKHLESLLDKYAEQWIAVKDCRVIASDVDLVQLRGKLEDPTHTCVEFVTHDPLEIL